MKNLRTLFLSIIVLCAAVSVVEAKFMKQYFTGSHRDKHNRTIIHDIAKNCDRSKEWSRAFAAEMFILAFQDTEEMNEEKPSYLIKDNNGETALDILTKKFESTQHPDCAKLMVMFKEEEAKEREALLALAQ